MESLRKLKKAHGKVYNENPTSVIKSVEVVDSSSVKERQQYSHQAESVGLIFYGFLLVYFYSQWFHANETTQKHYVEYFKTIGYELVTPASSNLEFMMFVLICDVIMLIPILSPTKRLCMILIPGIVVNVIWLAFSFQNLYKLYILYDIANDTMAVISDTFWPTFVSALHLWFIWGTMKFYNSLV